MLTQLTSNGQVSEEEPARDEGLLCVAGHLLHDVQIWGVEAEGSGGEAVRHQVDPEQLNWDQSLRETQCSRQKDALSRSDWIRRCTDKLQRIYCNVMDSIYKSSAPEETHQTTSPTLEEIRYLMNCFMLL